MTEANGGTQVRTDVVRPGDYIRFTGHKLHDRLSRHWWKVTNVDTRFGDNEPILQVINANGYTDTIHVTPSISIICHDYTYRRIIIREKGI